MEKDDQKTNNSIFLQEIPIMKSLIEIMKNDRIQFYLNIIRIISAVSALITFLGFALYSLGYSFLYGFYFGGENSYKNSLIELFLFPVPFNYYSVFLISSVIIVGIVFFWLLYKLFVGVRADNKLTNVATIFLMLVTFAMFHITLSELFVPGEIDFLEKSKSFILIWVVPFLLAVTLPGLFLMMTRPLEGVSGALYGIILTVILGKVYDMELTTIVLLPAFLFALIVSLLARKWRENKIYNIVILLPYSTCCTMIVYTLFIAEKIPLSILILCILFSLVVSYIAATYLVNLRKKKTFPDIILSESPLQVMVDIYKLNKIYFYVILIVFAFGTLIISPIFTANVGHYVRTYMSKYSFVQITDIRNKDSFVGNVVAEKNGVIYISDNNWELRMMNAQDIRMCCKKVQDNKVYTEIINSIWGNK
ncbi:hypothetical protein [Brevibacillus parabrevis]|uniref:hypothetical protein n=1 Tax=Brevibacillus parabrevis TaxID=54914 RepID=UPI0028D04805|nr:hypothetical protein [Brevibacillus parabrevis]